MSNIALDSKTSDALSHLQDTNLSPLEEALFQSWTKANHVKKPDAPQDHVDYRGIYKSTGGAILPNGELNRMASKQNSEEQLTQALHERMMDHIQSVTDKEGKREDQMHKAQRQDITHAQTMQKLPHEARMKEMDLKKEELSLQSQHLGNQGKKLDITKTLVAPKGNENAG